MRIAHLFILCSLAITLCGQSGLRNPAFVSELKPRPASGAVDNALILRYKFDEGSGTAVNDASANNNDATLSGGVAWITGKSGSGGAVRFAGTDDFLSTDAAVTYGASVVTVCAWVKAATWPGGAGAYRVFNSGPTGRGGLTEDVFHCFADFGTFQTGITGDATTSRRRDDTPDPTDGSWVHITMIFDNSTADGEITLYYDGVEQTADVYITTKTGTGNFSAQTLYIASLAGLSEFAVIDVDDFRIYSGQLTVTEIEHVRDNPDE